MKYISALFFGIAGLIPYAVVFCMVMFGFGWDYPDAWRIPALPTALIIFAGLNVFIGILCIANSEGF